MWLQAVDMWIIPLSDCQKSWAVEASLDNTKICTFMSLHKGLCKVIIAKQNKKKRLN